MASPGFVRHDGSFLLRRLVATDDEREEPREAECLDGQFSSNPMIQSPNRERRKGVTSLREILALQRKRSPIGRKFPQAGVPKATVYGFLEMKPGDFLWDNVAVNND